MFFFFLGRPRDIVAKDEVADHSDNKKKKKKKLKIVFVINYWSGW
jgi:hypothetical protein